MESQVIVDTMEVLETKPLNDLLTEATIKVCYVSDLPNRNNTVITEEVGRQIAATLPGAPVVGFFNEEAQDFEQHNKKLVIEGDKIRWESLTRPYGFVSTTASPWYQDFLEDGIVRKYLMCKAYLWTRQYQEASLIKQKGQSMELDQTDLQGYSEGDVFIFTSAVLDKLCILGDDYEPCFEGSNITTTYSSFYEDCAKLVEKYTGRRCYVLDGKLQSKEECNLDYAVKMGWAVEESLAIQLNAWSPDSRFVIEDIYMDTNGNFCIVRDEKTNAHYKAPFRITTDGQVEVYSNLIKVVEEWVPVETSLTQTPTPESYTKKDEDSLKESEEPSEEDKSDFSLDEEKPDSQEEEKEKESLAEAETESPEAADYSLEENKEEAKEETLKVVETKEESLEEASYYATKEIKVDTDFALLKEQIKTLEFSLSEKDKEIAALKEQIASYQLKEKEAEDEAKMQLFSQYSSLLSEEDMEEYKESVSSYTLDSLEAALAIKYARKSQKTNYDFVQVDVQKIGELQNQDLPSFISRALEIDKQFKF